MSLAGTIPSKPAVLQSPTVLPMVPPTPPPRPARAAGRAAEAPKAAPVTAKAQPQWYDWTEQPSTFISFIWNKGNRAIVLPYSRLMVVQTDNLLVFTGGEYLVRVEVTERFPLREFLLQFHFQFVIRLFSIPGDVKIKVVKIDSKTGAEIEV